MSDLPEKVDITRLAVYVNKIGELSSINKMMAPRYLQDFIMGQDVAANLLAQAIQRDSRAKAKLDYVESIAYLEKAKEYLELHSIKDTSEARKQYVNVDPDVISAKDVKASTEALVVLIKARLGQLRQAHDDLKKIVYGDQNLTPYEGM
jgi:hypothetical protein